MRFLGWKAQGLCHGEVEKEGALRVTGRTAEALLSAAHVFRGVLIFTLAKAAPLRDGGQLGDTVVAVVQILCCAP